MRQYPAKPVRLIWAVGQPMLMEVRSGAVGAVGADMVAKAALDGSTLLLTAASAITHFP